MKILFIDDEIVTTTLSKEGLEKLGHEVEAFTSSELALDAFKVSPDSFELVITDKHMPVIDGLELCTQIKKLNSSVPVLVLTGFVEEGGQNKMSQAGVDRYLLKPISINNINSAIEDLVTNQQTLSK